MEQLIYTKSMHKCDKSLFFFYILCNIYSNKVCMSVSPLWHKIGAVSALSGVPVPTLRAWELRHGAFAPHKTDGRHRLYSDADAQKATLLKQLTDAGHAIGTLAALDVAALQALLQRPHPLQHPPARGAAPGSALRVAVVDPALASRLQAQDFVLRLGAQPLQVCQVLTELPHAQDPPLQGQPEVLLVRLNTLHLPHQQRLQQLADQYAIRQVLVLYSFGPEKVLQAMQQAGMSVRREPVTDAELADWLLQARARIEPSADPTALQPAGMIPPRKYSDQTLAVVAGMADQLLCECPRHVAELITQLAHFEQYSQECLHNSPQDAHLHAYLSAVSGSARALFERALERVAQHEGISLS